MSNCSSWHYCWLHVSRSWFAYFSSYFMKYLSLYLSLSLSFSVHPPQFLLASLFWTAWPHTPFSTIHSWCCFSHCSLCSSPFPTFCPVTALRGSGAGWDDSRTCFSLWVYYLCSGPFKTTQNGPGSQCGEFVLTSCLFLLIFLLLLLLPRSSLPSPRLWGIGRGRSRDSLFPALCLLFLLDLATWRHLISRLTLHLPPSFHCGIEACVLSSVC